MNADDVVQLFILNNAVITQSLRAVFVKERVGNARGSLETRADSLVADYLRQIDFEILSDAERMSEF